MTARRAIVATLALGLIALVVWKVGRVVPHAPLAAPTANTSGSTPPAARPSVSPQLERSPLADALNSPATDIRADLRVVSDIVETFRTNFPKDGNPVGTNAEITAVLVGKNKLRLSLIPSDHSAINKAGELCDRWGTPFFFHAESATRMEIRSAGPDKKMWSDDDAVFVP